MTMQGKTRKTTFGLSALSLALALNMTMVPAYSAWYDNENTFLDRGKQSYNSGQFDQALSQFTECVKANPSRADAYYWRAMTLMGLKQPERALHDLDEAIKLSPDCASCYMHRGLIYSNQGKLEEAIKEFDQALRYDPGLADAETNRKFCVNQIEKNKIAKETAKVAPASTVLALAGDSVNKKPAVVASTAGSGKTSVTASSTAATNDPQWIKLQKELEFKAQKERAEAERLAIARIKAENESKLLEAKLNERKEKDKALQEEREARRIASNRTTKVVGKLPTTKVEPEVTTDEAPSLEIVNRPVRDKWALIVGISSFADKSLNLRYPAKDAKDFYNFLIKEGNFAPDHVRLLVNEQATRANILSDLGDKWLPRVANPDDLVLVYISSHGSASEMDVGRLKLSIAYDSQVDSLYASGLAMQDLTRIIKGRVHSDRVVIMLDACHSGAVDVGAKGLQRTNNVDAAAIAQGTGQLVISSSTPSQVSWESKQYENSVFTRCLIDSLRKNGATTTLGEAFQNLKDKVQEEVLRERGVMQTPVLKSRWSGQDLRLSSPAVSPRVGLAN
ncbi:MAG: caspase family protein [Candidatus Obscuribacter sp.]|nr:caspase family protein [Candidatus Obscuribacter sp.]